MLEIVFSDEIVDFEPSRVVVWVEVEVEVEVGVDVDVGVGHNIVHYDNVLFGVVVDVVVDTSKMFQRILFFCLMVC